MVSVRTASGPAPYLPATATTSSTTPAAHGEGAKGASNRHAMAATTRMISPTRDVSGCNYARGVAVASRAFVPAPAAIDPAIGVPVARRPAPLPIRPDFPVFSPLRRRPGGFRRSAVERVGGAH